MASELCFILDYKKLVLESGNLYDIDKYTSKNFCTTKEIRSKYKNKIEEFLKQFNSPGFTYENIGSIAVYVYSSDYPKKQVLLKKHIISLEEIIKIRSVMIDFSNYQRQKGNSNSLVSEYFQRMVRQPWDKKGGAKGYVKKWLKEEKNGNNYYAIARDLLYIYERQRRIYPNLKSIDHIYNQYKEKKVIEKVESLGNIELQKDVKHLILEETSTEEKKYNIAGRKYNEDELHLFDTDELEKIIDTEGSDYIPDVIKGSKL